MISINNVAKSYGKRVLFEKISLTINRGEKIGLVGPNGTGKSTLFHLIMGDMELSEGNINVPKNIFTLSNMATDMLKQVKTRLAILLVIGQMVRGITLLALKPQTPVLTLMLTAF